MISHSMQYQRIVLPHFPHTYHLGNYVKDRICYALIVGTFALSSRSTGLGDGTRRPHTDLSDYHLHVIYRLFTVVLRKVASPYWYY